MPINWNKHKHRIYQIYKIYLHNNNGKLSQEPIDRMGNKKARNNAIVKSSNRTANKFKLANWQFNKLKRDARRGISTIRGLRWGKGQVTYVYKRVCMYVMHGMYVYVYTYIY